MVFPYYWLHVSLLNLIHLQFTFTGKWIWQKSTLTCTQISLTKARNVFVNVTFWMPWRMETLKPLGICHEGWNRPTFTIDAFVYLQDNTVGWLRFIPKRSETAIFLLTSTTIEKDNLIFPYGHHAVYLGSKLCSWVPTAYQINKILVKKFKKNTARKTWFLLGLNCSKLCSRWVVKARKTWFFI